MKNIERLNNIKETLLCAVECEVCELEEADAKELGEVIDMIKDIEEAIYYHTVTEAMHQPTHEMEWEVKKKSHHQMNDDGKENAQWVPHYDEHAGRSHMSRKAYLEARNANKDKAIQLRELEKYMAELSQDITEMIAEATADEKQYLEKRITALASKIGQMK